MKPKKKSRPGRASPRQGRIRRPKAEPTFVPPEPTATPAWMSPPDAEAPGWFAAPMPAGQGAPAGSWIMIPAPWFQTPDSEVPGLSSPLAGLLPPRGETTVEIEGTCEHCGEEVHLVADLCQTMLPQETSGLAPILPFPALSGAPEPDLQPAAEAEFEASTGAPSPEVKAEESLGAVLFEDLEPEAIESSEALVLEPSFDPEPTFLPDLADEPDGLEDLETHDSEVEDLLPGSHRTRSRVLLGAVASVAVIGLVIGLLPDDSSPVPTPAPELEASRVATPAPRPVEATVAPTPPQTLTATEPTAPPPVQVTEDPAPIVPRMVRRRGRRASMRVLPRQGPRPKSAKLANLLVKGRRAYLRESYGYSYRAYRRAVQTDPKNAEARFGLALTAFQFGRNAQSRRQVEATLRLQPEHPDALILLGFLDQVGSRLSMAAERYERYLVLYPDGEWADEIRSVLATLNDA